MRGVAVELVGTDQSHRADAGQLKAAPRHEVSFTLECSGNDGRPPSQSLVGNAQWTGTRLADVLKSAGLQDKAVEVLFYGADRG
jgi:DMSO/TMAO reductase YedYZ molybdopterin-dependent catalytic subunit